MLSHRFTRISLRSSAWGLFIVLLVVACTLGSWTSRRHPQAQADASVKTHTPAEVIQQRALTLCLAFGDSSRMMALPECDAYVFIANRDGQYQSGWRNVWTVYCEVDGKGYYLEFNDATGNLIGIRSRYLEPNKAAQQIRTPTEAASIALMRLQTMRLVPADARIQQKETPVYQDQYRAWKTTWTVDTPSSKEPYLIRYILGDVDGKPIRLMNEREAGTLREGRLTSHLWGIDG